MLFSSPRSTTFFALFAFVLLVSEVKHVKAKNSIEGISRGLKKSKKAAAKKRKKGKRTGRGNFLSFTFDLLDELEKKVCENESVCQNVKRYQQGGIDRNYENILPARYYANFRAMCLAYPIFLLPEFAPSFRKTLQLHRALGLGDSLHSLGNAKEIVKKGYWHHYDLLGLEDDNEPVPGDGLSAYCSYTSDEYEQLKKFAVDNFEEDFSSSPTFGLSTAPTPFYLFCMNSFLVRSDWEHHRKQAVSSLMSADSTEAIVQYTVWHWESLFIFRSSEAIASTQLYNSIDALLKIL